MKLEWIESDGGPLLFCPATLLGEWHGVQQVAPSGVSDYDRACAVKDEIDQISVGRGNALVLGDEPDRTALLQDDNHLFIIRWRWAESEDVLLDEFVKGAGTLAFGQVGGFSTEGGEHVLFDSADNGMEANSSLRVTLNSKGYSIATALFKPNDSYCALIHRLTPN